MKKWIVLFGLLLLLGCENWGREKYQKKLKILNSFSQDMVFSQIWPDLFAAFQCENTDISAIAINIEPQNLSSRLQRMIAVQSLPNLVYMKVNDIAAEYLIENNLLQNLRSEQQVGNLSQLNFFPPALTSQGHGQDTLWFLPLTINVSSVLFVNEQLLLQEGLAVPGSMEELEQSIELLRVRGYQYPLLAHSSYTEDILHNLLSSLVAHYIGPDFFWRSSEDPQLFQDPRFRAVMEEYISYLKEDGILPPEVRNMETGSSLRYFNLGLSAFMLAAPEVSEFFVGGENGAFRSQISWRYLPIGKNPGKNLENNETLGRTLDGGIDSRMVSGEIESGYGITSPTSLTPALQKQALEFIDFIFSDGLALYKQEDVSYTVFSTPVGDSEPESLSYGKKRDFYTSRSSIIENIQAKMLPQESEVLMGTIEDHLNGLVPIEKAISLFYISAIRHKTYEGSGKGSLHNH